MTKEEKLNLLLLMLKCTKDKTRRAAILSSYIQVNGPIPNEYVKTIFKVLKEDIRSEQDE